MQGLEHTLKSIGGHCTVPLESQNPAGIFEGPPWLPGGTGWGQGWQDGGMESRDDVHFTGERTEVQVTCPRSCLQQGSWFQLGGWTLKFSFNQLPLP